MNARQHPQRKSPRLKGYDYAQPGAYFVTICTSQREPLFGRVANGVTVLSAIGQIAHDAWLETPRHFLNIVLDTFVVMPNHVHAIVMITETVSEMADVGTRYISSLQPPQPSKCPSSPENTPARPKGFKPGSLGAVVGIYKAAVTRRANRELHSTGRIWQERYHDHIIRNQQELDSIREYVCYNPERWQIDVFYNE